MTAKDDEEYQALFAIATTNKSYNGGSPTRTRDNLWTGYTRGPDCSPVTNTSTGHASECTSSISNYYWTDGSPSAFIDLATSSYWVDSEISAQNSVEHCTVLTLPHGNISDGGF